VRRRRDSGYFVLWALVALATPARADELPEGAVVVLGEVDDARTLAAARDAGGARFRADRFEAASPDAPDAPTELVGTLRERYLDADFLRCLARLSDSALDRWRLLEEGHREAFAEVAVFGAACAHGAADEALARGLLESAVIAAVDLAPHLPVTNPEFQALAASVRDAASERGRARLTLTTRPSGAHVIIDGGAVECRATPCELSLVPGEHVLLIRRLGAAPRIVRQAVREDMELALRLDPAPADELRAQLGEAIHAEMAPDAAPFVRAVASAVGARVVVIAWRADGRAHALVYDRALSRVVARTSVEGDDPTTAVRATVVEWRGVVEPTPLYAEPLFWAGIAGVTTVTAIVVYLLVSPPEPRHDIVFRAR
jgi:hypothetical protein